MKGTLLFVGSSESAVNSKQDRSGNPAFSAKVLCRKSAVYRQQRTENTTETEKLFNDGKNMDALCMSWTLMLDQMGLLSSS